MQSGRRAAIRSTIDTVLIRGAVVPNENPPARLHVFQHRLDLPLHEASAVVGCQQDVYFRIVQHRRGLRENFPETESYQAGQDGSRAVFRAPTANSAPRESGGLLDICLAADRLGSALSIDSLQRAFSAGRNTVSVPVACPHCGHSVSISDEKYAASSGKTAKCSRCGKPFSVQRAVAPTATADVLPSPAPVGHNTSVHGSFRKAQ